MKLKVFRSVWGLPVKDMGDLVKRIHEGGFQGVEASLGDVDAIVGGRANRKEWKEALQLAGLQYIAGVYTSWQDYEGPWEDKPVSEHVGQFKDQLEAVRELSPSHINAHSGQDSWSSDEAETFFEQALRVEQQAGLGCKVSHETHRGRVLGDPWRTERLIDRFPDLLITGDFSHWFVVGERLLNGSEREKRMWSKVIPRTAHVHARVGSEQRPQHDDTGSTDARAARQLLDDIWSKVWKLPSHLPDQVFSATPEYGPPPYGDAQDTSEIAVREAARLRQLFSQL